MPWLEDRVDALDSRGPDGSCCSPDVSTGNQTEVAEFMVSTSKRIFASVADQSEEREGRMIENRNRLLGVLLAAVLVALGVLAYLSYEKTKPVAKIDLPGVSGEITKEGVDIEVGKPKN